MAVTRGHQSEGQPMRDAIAEAAFQPVMATGVLSLTARTVGWGTVSLILLWLAICAFGVLLVYHAVRLDRRPSVVLSELRTGAIFSYLTLVAGGAVLADGILALGWNRALAWTVLVFCGVFWLVLVVVILLELLALGSLHPRSEAQGGWLLAVVAPQALGILTLALAGRTGVGALPVIALALWILASILYLPLAMMRVLRLERARDTVTELRSDDWILMGALAISTLGAARLLDSPWHHDLGTALTGLLSGVVWIEFVLACCWIPLLVWGEIEHLRRGTSLRAFAARRWSTIFPLGMFSIACQALAQRTQLDGLTLTGEVFFVVALGLWLATIAVH